MTDAMTTQYPAGLLQEAGLLAVRDDRLAVKAELHRIAPECDEFLARAYAATPNRGGSALAAIPLSDPEPLTDLPCGYCSRDFPHSHTKAILIGPDEQPHPASKEADLDVAYRERNAVVAALVRTNGWPAWVIPAPDAEGWFIVYAESDEGQLSWHIGPGDLDLFSWLPTQPRAGWDGWDRHTTEEKYQRLAALAAPVALDEVVLGEDAVVYYRDGWREMLLKGTVLHVTSAARLDKP